MAPGAHCLFRSDPLFVACVPARACEKFRANARSRPVTVPQEATRDNMNEKDFFNAHLDSQVPSHACVAC